MSWALNLYLNQLVSTNDKERTKQNVSELYILLRDGYKPNDDKFIYTLHFDKATVESYSE